MTNEGDEPPLAETPEPAWYCLSCATENILFARICRQCGRALQLSARQQREGVAFLLNELEALHEEGALPRHLYEHLRQRYRDILGPGAAPAPRPAGMPGAPQPATAPPAARPARGPVAPQPATAPPAARPATPRPPAPRPPREGPGWLAEQQANLLLYLGAFLIVIATLVFVSASGEAVSGAVKMALLLAGTLVFMGAGIACMRFPRVKQAGVAFFAVGALMVPLNFVGVYAFFFADDEIDPTGLWIAGSLVSTLFYGATAMAGLGRWYSAPAIVGLGSALGAVLSAVGAPPEAYPGSFIALALIVVTPSLLPLGRISEIFGEIGLYAANATAPLAAIAALVLAGVDTDSGSEPLFELGTRWYLPPTYAIATLFYGAQAFRLGRWYAPPAIVALGGTLGALLFAVDAAPEAYPGSFIALALIVAAPSLLPLGRVSEVFGETGLYAANVTVPLAAIAALAMALAGSDAESGFELETRWYLPPTYAIVTLFYGAVAFARLERWYATPAIVALGGTLGALLFAVDAAPEAYPGSFIALALIVITPSLLPLGRVSEVFGETGLYAAHATVPLAAIAALAMAGVDAESGFEVATRWYLPPTGAMAALFYWAHTIRARGHQPELDTFLPAAALAVTGGALITIVYALDVGRQWYGPAVAIVGGLYASGSVGFGLGRPLPARAGQRFLGWFALGSFTVSWIFFEGIYDRFPRHGAGVHFASTLFYIVAAARAGGRLRLFEKVDSKGRGTGEWFEAPRAMPLVYAAGVTLGVGYYHLLSSLPAADTAGASDLSLAFFWLSLGVAAVAAALRWVQAEARWHVYGVALGMSLFVLLAAIEAEGRVTALLASYAAVALAIALWERLAVALPLAAAYGFFALLAAWRHYDANVAYLPLTLSGVGCSLYAAHIPLAARTVVTKEQPLDYLRDWSLTLLALAVAYAAAAPVVGWLWLDGLADPEGFVDGQSFEQTLLYQTCAASVMLLGLLVAAQSWLKRRVELGVLASALLMVALLLQIGHWRPENVQAYTAPLGAYLLAAALLALRVRELPVDLRSLLGPLEVVGAGLIMAPSFGQSLDEGAWRYGVILLSEALAFVALALIQRRLWLLAVAVTFVVLDGFHYLFFAGGPPVPSWALLAIAGTAVMLAGTAILFGRERWTEWQQVVLSWWNREPPLPAAK